MRETDDTCSRRLHAELFCLTLLSFRIEHEPSVIASLLSRPRVVSSHNIIFLLSVSEEIIVKLSLLTLYFDLDWL